MNNELSPREDKGLLIYLIIVGIFIPIVIIVGFFWLTTPEDHGEVVDMKAWWRMPAIYDGHIIESGDEYVLCQVTYEDGTKAYVHDWTIEKPVTIDKNKKVKFTVIYGDFECKTSVGPAPKEQQNTTNIHLTRAEQNAALAEDIIVGYPGHDHQWYLDQLNNEGLSYSEAEAALQVAGY